MSTAKQELRVLLDEGAPEPASTPFLDRGHQVINHRDVLASGAGDELVALTAILNQAVLMAVDLDMKRLVRRFGSASDGGKFNTLNLIWIGCDPVMTVKRVANAMSFIENEWAFCCEKAARRLWISIENHRLTTYR